MSNHDDDDPMDNIQTMGIINALKTGDMRVDMLIAMCIPIIFRMFFGMMERMEDGGFEKWMEWLMQGSNKRLHQRVIVHRSEKSIWRTASIDKDNQNATLIKAIQLFVHHECNLDLKSASLDLTTLQDKSSNNNYGGYYSDDDDDDDNGDDNGDSSRKTLAGMLGKYKVVKKPPRNAWHNVGHFGKPAAPVRLWINEREENVDTKYDSQQRCTLTLQFSSPKGSAIDCFIDEAYKWYMNELRKLEDNSRYLYELKDLGSSSKERTKKDDDDNNGRIVYSRYRLSDDKTFESLFFHQKQQLLGLVKHFQNKSGKYGIKGYPHKLGLLLHGPPGTGKTSLIKALAQHTNRSIVNVSLSKISTNSDLMSVFFDKRYFIQGEDIPVNLGFKDVIFVMEDVDAAAKVVKRRDGKTGGESVSTRSVETTTMTEEFPKKVKSLWRMLLESNDGDCRDLVKKLIEKSSRLKEEATKPEILVDLSKRMAVLPGLGFVGEEGPSRMIGDEAVQSANAVMESYSTVDRFMSVHAKSIKALIDSGAKVSDAFVDSLLGIPFQMPTPSPPSPRAMISHPMAEKDNESNSSHGMNMTNDHDELLAMAMERMEKMERTERMEKKDITTSSNKKGWKLDSSSALNNHYYFKPPKDQLNLSGLLNVLDGVVDTPGRILIMTTNHPEMLDPALIRPGRIDKKILLGYMGGLDVVCMLEHYFQTSLDESQRSRVLRAMEDMDLTPAQIEQMSAENDDVDEMISWLEAESHVNYE